MRLVTYRDGQGSSLGALLGTQVIDINSALASYPGRPGHLEGRRFQDAADLFLSDGALAVAQAAVQAVSARADSRRELASLQLLPPVLRPTKVIGVGMNYRSFVEQLGEALPLHPVLFHKTASALTGAGSPIIIPPVTDEAVPEGELAVVIGRRAASISPADVERHIAGYTCANDVSARNLEFRTSQWTSGKMLDTFCPLGPALVTTDEVGNPNELELKTLLNGRVIQQGHTSGMIFQLPRLISELSTLVTLEVGDVILTGTPSDLGELKPPIFLAHGDTLRVEIDGIGVLENPVISSRTAARP